MLQKITTLTHTELNLITCVFYAEGTEPQSTFPVFY